MDYVELTCKVVPPEPWRDILISQLADIGFDSFEETEDGFKAYITLSEYREEYLDQALKLPAVEAVPEIFWSTAEIGSKNWNQVWESNFEPVIIGKKCYVRAPFHQPRKDVEMEIVIEPKMSFGTGHHETTTLMAEWLLETPLKGLSLVDMGCGAGILAILAAKRGARPVTAIDNYIFAWENTRENIERNDLPFINVLHGDASLLGKEKYDVVVANITRNVLLDDMEKYEGVLNKNGMMFISGFIEKDKKMVALKAKSLGLNPTGEKKEKDWVSLKFIKA